MDKHEPAPQMALPHGAVGGSLFGQIVTLSCVPGVIKKWNENK